jgi:oligoendopeptidase F
MIAYTIDTSDAGKAADHLRFSTDILPKAEERSVGLARRLLDSGFTRPDMETTIRRFRTASEIFREENVPIFAEVEEHSATYQRITGSMTAVWEGIERPLPQLQPFLKSRDREVRERAWRAATGPYLAQRDTLASLFDTMFALRQRAAANAGFADFRDYSFQSKFRFDYTPADCERFHDAVEAAAVPAVDRLYQDRRRRLAPAMGSPGRARPPRAAASLRDGSRAGVTGAGNVRASRAGARRRISADDRRAAA